jgi:hypothetical protein
MESIKIKDDCKTIQMTKDSIGEGSKDTNSYFAVLTFSLMLVC